MAYAVLALIFRKPGLTPQEFRTHYNTVHVPLLRSLVGDTFPISHTRNYVSRHKEEASDSSTTPPTDLEASDVAIWKSTLFIGEASNFSYDSLTVMVWENKEAFERFAKIFYSDKVQEAIKEDEKKFMDTSLKMACALEEPVVTTRANL